MLEKAAVCLGIFTLIFFGYILIQLFLDVWRQEWKREKGDGRIKKHPKRSGRKCPKCGDRMSTGAPHDPAHVYQYKCSGCGYVIPVYRGQV